MKDITVPKQFAHEMRDDRSPEYKIACIRDYVKSHAEKVITMADFQTVAGTNAQTYIARLRKSGHLVRYSIKNGTKGHSYGYRWVEKRVRTEESRDGSVTTVTSLGYEPFPLGTDGNLLFDTVADHYMIENVEILSGDEIKGIVKLKKHVRSEYDRVKQQRADALAAHQKGGSNE